MRLLARLKAGILKTEDGCMLLSLDKDNIARCFRRSLPTYDEAAIVQNRLAAHLLEMLQSLPDSAFRSVLEIGCCTGGLTEMLCREKPVTSLFLNDLVPEFEDVVLRRLEQYNSVELNSCFGDIEKVDLPEELSLVLSGATLQWLSDLPSFFNRLGRELEPGTYLAFSLFGPGTLKEFSHLTSVELNYYPHSQITAMLEEDFFLECDDHCQEQLFFPSVREIMDHIRATGVGGVSEYRWNKDSLRRFTDGYQKEFGGERGLPVSYVSSCFVARRR
jgi:malonyl-CoA O-methyltransferase